MTAGSTAPPTAGPDAGGRAARGATPGRRTRPSRVRRTAAYLGAVGLGLLLVVLLALSAQRPGQPLDPEGPGPAGGMALAEVLQDQGVDVEVVRSITALESSAPDASTTVLVGDPANLGAGAVERLRATARFADRLVLVGVGNEQLRRLGLPVEAFAGGAAEELVARCSSSTARDSDVVTTFDTRYLVSQGPGATPGSGARASTSCFALPEPGDPAGEPAPDGAYGAAFVELAATDTDPQTLVVGFGPAWSNERVTKASHAGTAVRALGSTPRLVWYQPGAGDLTAPGPGGATGEGAGVWPVWTAPATALLAAAVVVLALVRGRRLGRLVHEPLPVVVRAVETTESRGRLYRRAGDHGRAAAVLRAGTSERLSRRLGVPQGAGPLALVHAVSVASGRPAHEVVDILSGPPPHDDTALILLAQQLTDLEERARHP